MSAFQTQRKVARILYLFGASAALVNFLVFFFVRGLTIIEILTNYFFYLEVLFTLVIFLTRRIDHGLVRFVHVLIILLVSILGILDEYDSFYGLGFFILAVLLSYRYGYLEKRLKLKIGLSILMLIALIEYSTLRNDTNETAIALDAMVFLILFGSLVYYIFQEDIERLSKTNSDLKSNLENLKDKRLKLETELSEKNREIDLLERVMHSSQESDEIRRKQFQAEYRLTNMESKVIMLAYDTGESNQYLADLLGRKEGTIKQHINRAFGKIDVRSRSEMHTMIRDYLAGKL